MQGPNEGNERRREASSSPWSEPFNTNNIYREQKDRPLCNEGYNLGRLPYIGSKSEWVISGVGGLEKMDRNISGLKNVFLISNPIFQTDFDTRGKKYHIRNILW